MRKKFVLSAMLSLLLLSGCRHSDNMSNNQDSGTSSSSKENEEMASSVFSLPDGCDIIYSNENGDEIVDTIMGKFVDFNVTDDASAMKAMSEISGLLGIKDVNTEIELMDVQRDMYGVYYSFRQNSGGIPVYDRRTVLTADPENNEVTELSNSFYHLDNMDKEPIIDCEKAKSLIEEKYDCKIESDPQLNIAFSYGDSPQLIWIVEVSQDNIANVIVDAGNGEILYSEPSYIED